MTRGGRFHGLQKSGSSATKKWFGDYKRVVQQLQKGGMWVPGGQMTTNMGYRRGQYKALK